MNSFMQFLDAKDEVNALHKNYMPMESNVGME
jgi:hypothetical protein